MWAKKDIILSIVGLTSVILQGKTGLIMANHQVLFFLYSHYILSCRMFYHFVKVWILNRISILKNKKIKDKIHQIVLSGGTKFLLIFFAVDFSPVYYTYRSYTVLETLLSKITSYSYCGSCKLSGNFNFTFFKLLGQKYIASWLLTYTLIAYYILWPCPNTLTPVLS